MPYPRRPNATDFFARCAPPAAAVGTLVSTMNCWEFRECGREPGGCRVDALGVCPVAACVAAHGLYHGVNGGRVCWAIPGCQRPEAPEASSDERIRSCVTCDFFKLVHEQESPAPLSIHDIQELLSVGSSPASGRETG